MIKSLDLSMKEMMKGTECLCKQYYSSNYINSYCNGDPPKGYTDPDQISWLRPE